MNERLPSIIAVSSIFHIPHVRNGEVAGKSHYLRYYKRLGSHAKPKLATSDISASKSKTARAKPPSSRKKNNVLPPR
jgi:hypothetical protein